MQVHGFLKNKVCPISQSGGIFAEVLRRSLQQEVRVHEFPNFQLALETFLRVLLQKLLKIRSVLVPCNPSFLQRQRLGENSDSFNHNWFEVSVKLHLTAGKVLLDTARDIKEAARKQHEKMNRFWLFSKLRKCFQGSANKRKNSKAWGLICLRGKQGIRK